MPTNPLDILYKYGITPPPAGASGYIKFSAPSGTYPGRSYNAFASAYDQGMREYANAVAQQQQPAVTPTIAPSTPTPTATTTATPTVTPTTWPTTSPSAGITTPQINYTPANNADYIRSMSDLINQINQDAQRSANAGRIPMAGALEAQSSKNIQSALQGILPEDVQYQIAQKAAERGVGRGSPMGASTTADLMRALGLTSLQLQGTGQDWLTGAYGRNPAAPIFDPTKLLITPGMATEFGLRQGEFDLNKLQLDLQTQLQRDQQQLQRDLANASNQLERDRLIWQFQQNELQRRNALEIARINAERYAQQGGRGPTIYYGGGGGQPTGGGQPQVNWADLFNQPQQRQGTMATTTNPPFGPFNYDLAPNPSSTWDFGQPVNTGYDINPQTPVSPWDFGMPVNTGYDIGGGGTMDWGDLTPDELIALYTGGY